jgi:enoyl-CoA hydratase/carnithine racemase
MAALDTGTEDLRAEIDGGVAVITMNRPDRRNAFSPVPLSERSLSSLSPIR